MAENDIKRATLGNPSSFYLYTNYLLVLLLHYFHYLIFLCQDCREKWKNIKIIVVDAGFERLRGIEITEECPEKSAQWNLDFYVFGLVSERERDCGTSRVGFAPLTLP